MPPHVGPHRENEVVQLIIAQTERARFAIVDPARSSEPMAVLTAEELPAAVRDLEAESHPRWVWAETQLVYPALLDAGVRVERCHDLRLCAAILDRSTLTEQLRSSGRSSRPTWLAPGPAEAGRRTSARHRAVDRHAVRSRRLRQFRSGESPSATAPTR